MNLELHKSKNLLKILNTAIDAGKEIQKVYKKSFNVKIKDDNSPITEADIKSNNLILNRLKSYNADVPILSEESLVEWQERKTWNYYWLIDPLDGTKEFIKKNGEVTVNIALIKNNSPIFGIIYAENLIESDTARIIYIVFFIIGLGVLISYFFIGQLILKWYNFDFKEDKNGDQKIKDNIKSGISARILGIISIICYFIMIFIVIGKGIRGSVDSGTLAANKQVGS